MSDSYEPGRRAGGVSGASAWHDGADERGSSTGSSEADDVDADQVHGWKASHVMG